MATTHSNNQNHRNDEKGGRKNLHDPKGQQQFSKHAKHQTQENSYDEINLSNAARIMRSDPDPEKRKRAAKIMGHAGGLHSHINTNNRR